MFVTGTLGGITGGVSQQPAILRYEGQCSEQTNFKIDPVNGLVRRGNVDLIAELTGVSGAIAVHWFSLEDEDFVAVFTGTTVTVYDMSGTLYTPDIATGAYDYMQVGGFNPDNISTVQVGEYNLIANSAVKCKMSSSVEDDDEYVVFHIQDGMNWGTTYEIKHNNVSKASYTSAPGDTIDATTIETTSSLYITLQLYNTLEPLVAAEGWTCLLRQNTILMRRLVAAHTSAFQADKFTIEDSLGGAASECTIHEVDQLDKLPPRAYPGHWCRVHGSDSTSIDDFYMKYITDDVGDVEAEGVWNECATPLEKNTLDEDTLPHALIRAEDGTFVFTAIDGSTVHGSEIDTWADRESGDDESNIPPAFIEGYIKSMTMVQQRLCIIVDDHVCMSRSQMEFTYFDSSQLAGVDSDPIQLTTPGERAAHLFAALEHEQNLIVLGVKKQFAVPLRAALTPSNASLVPTTAYDVTPNCTPTSAAHGMYFAFEDKNRTGIREYRTGEVESIHLAEEITAHLDGYIPTGLTALHADRQNNIILGINGTSSVYMYQFLSDQGQLVMSAWGKLVLPCATVSVRSLDGDFYIVANSALGMGLFKLNKDTEYFMDLQYEGTVLADGAIDISGWNASAIAGDVDVDLACVMYSGSNIGLELQVDTISTTEIVLKDTDVFIGEQVLLGFKYNSQYTPTMPVIRDAKDKARELDNVTVNLITVQVQDTGKFWTTTSAAFYDDVEQEYTGTQVGSSFVVGAPTVSSRIEQIAVGHKARNVNVRIHTNDVYDCIIQSMEYKGAYTQRGARI